MLDEADVAARYPPRATARQRARLVRRFALTIAQPKPLVVTYYDIQGMAVQTVTGLPRVAREQMIYVETRPRYLTPIPVISIVNIRPLYS